jgi:hydrogenase/urease accessory protein HupE
MNRPRHIGVAGALLLGMPGAAWANLVSSGLGPFYDGVLHLLLTPSDLLALVALALLAGLGGPRTGRWVILVLPAAWLAGGSIGLRLETVIAAPGFSAGLLVLAAALVAADVRLPPPAVLVLAVLIGAVHGVPNGAALAAMGAGAVGLLGVVVMVQVIGLVVAALVVSLRAAWSRIAVRVAGSWIAAAGMLMAGWLMHGSG